MSRGVSMAGDGFQIPVTLSFGLGAVSAFVAAAILRLTGALERRFA
jgi:hypothetical protein